MSQVTSNPGSGQEEEEEQRKTGRSAFFAGVHQADSFSGSYRGVKPAPHGGAISVRPEDTIGSADRCWCGRPANHWWPGQDHGKKHPTEKEMAMSAIAETDSPYLSASDLSNKWDRRVAKFITDLVNDFHVRFRIIDGSHLLLYPFDDSRPRKISAARNAEEQLGYLEKWVHEHIAPNIVSHQAEALALRFNDPTKRRRTKAAQKPVEPTPVPEPSPEPVGPPTPAPAPPVTDPETFEAAPKGYHQHISTKGTVTNWWEADDMSGYLCKSCDYTVQGKTLQGVAAHQRLHSMTAEERTEVSRSAALATDHELQGRRTRARNAIRFLMEEYEIKAPKEKGDTSKLEKRIAALEQQLAKVTAERDDMKARYDLIKEAMRA